MSLESLLVSPNLKIPFKQDATDSNVRLHSVRRGEELLSLLYQFEGETRISIGKEAPFVISSSFASEITKQFRSYMSVIETKKYSTEAKSTLQSYKETQQNISVKSEVPITSTSKSQLRSKIKSILSELLFNIDQVRIDKSFKDALFIGKNRRK